ncbi:hypothetical protein DF107_06030 [Burkholderia stagnalis]|uniref:hypothetical protein n=1 Tax=Burkholderia stagnalis TaxID=1503054 RepID=UPI0009C09BFF|nr:hypothetical protein [Burkholderia stagnalis]RQQ16908.1 hypothetical protein DF164_01595 [Burkholderia stagnalis]RQQ20835.1 hypothetical protein DF161_03995 [Burkholderia stagnalis]RQQ40433.1 hypothetical protein DF148_04175 [Burkholderia stagnalis]RQR05596.1 hypothetical protein DF031_01595 [Burkholderia stagnalis]RQX94610.1 hypothetical protein DF120_08975 [Burkholderia stagnalis]
MHTGASASIHNSSLWSPERGLPSMLGAPIAGFGPVGAASGHLSASRGAGDEARRSHAKSTIDLAAFMVRPVMSRDGEIACLPLRGKPLDATAPAFAIATRSA